MYNGKGLVCVSRRDSTPEPPCCYLMTAPSFLSTLLGFNEVGKGERHALCRWTCQERRHLPTSLWCSVGSLGEWDVSVPAEGAFTVLVPWDTSLLPADSCGVTALEGLCSQFMKMDEQIGWPQWCVMNFPDVFTWPCHFLRAISSQWDFLGMLATFLSVPSFNNPLSGWNLWHHILT